MEAFLGNRHLPFHLKFLETDFKMACVGGAPFGKKAVLIARRSIQYAGSIGAKYRPDVVPKTFLDCI